MGDWVTGLEHEAPNMVAAWRGIEVEQFLSIRREVRRRSGRGSAARILSQLDVLAGAIISHVEALPQRALELPGRGGLERLPDGRPRRNGAGRPRDGGGAGASGRWPTDATPVIPGVPGSHKTDRAELVRKLVQSQRIIARAAAQVAGHEEEPCPLDHPLVGRLRCGKWLLFAGVHDLMHLEQLHRIAATLSRDPAAPAGESPR